MRYLAYTWPEYQDYMEEDWFKTESYYDPDKDVYLLPDNRVEEFDLNNHQLRHKVGDIVIINSKDWYNNWKDDDGDVTILDFVFTEAMSIFCGRRARITEVREDCYTLNIDNGYYEWIDEMFEEW